jgi:hypothetical protein
MEASIEFLLLKYEDFMNITSLFEDISRVMEDSVKKYGAFIKI